LGNEPLVKSVLNDYTTAPVSERVRAALGLLKKVTLDHANVTADDIRTVKRAGVSMAAIEDALEVGYLFNVYDRLADTMGWDVPLVEAGYYKAAAKRLLKHGYR
jgi:alkylhydroperoxidase family enzyme